MSCVPFAYWAALDEGEINDSLVRAGLDDENAGIVSSVLSELMLDAAREEEANYEYLCSLLGYTPTGLEVVGEYDTTFAHDLYADMELISATYAIGASDETTIYTVDFSDPTNPTTADSDSKTGATFQHVAVRGDYALLSSLATDTVYLYDVSDPTALSEVDSLTIGNLVYSATFLDDDFVAVRADLPGALYRTIVYNWDATGFGAEEGFDQFGQISNRDQATSPDGNYVAVVDQGNDELIVFDVSDRANPSLIDDITDGDLAEPRMVEYFNDDYVLASGYGSTGDLLVFDVTTPSAITKAGATSTGQIGSSGIAVMDDTYAAWIRGTSGGVGILDIIDLSDPTNPTTFLSLTDAALEFATGIVFDGSRYLVMNTLDDRVVVVDTLA